VSERPIPRHRAGAAPAVGNGPRVRGGGRDGTASTDRPPTSLSVRRVRPGWLGLVAAAVALGLVIGLVLVHRPGDAANAHAGSTGPLDVTNADTSVGDPVAAQPVSAARLATLPQATTWGVIPDAPLDPSPDQVPSGALISPSATVAVYAAPGGPPIAALPAQQLDGNHQPVGQTSVPVIATTPGWARVLLPTKPNGATGWVDTSNPRISETATPYLIRVDRNHYHLTLLRAGTPIGQWTVGVGMLRTLDGRTQSVTPTGRTFVIADIQIAQPTYSPIILPLGFHSPVYDAYGGGPATVGIHTWTYSSAVYGQPSSHGCVRVPAAALHILSTEVPIGTPVVIS
jgi:L,D-transpeptidase catalytic domain